MFDTQPTKQPLSAVTTEWSPLKPGGTNFRTHKFVAVDGDTVQFKATTGAVVFYSVFLIAGLIPLGIGLFQGIKHGFDLRVEVVIPLAFGLVFTALGWFLVRYGTKPIVFDRRRGYFWKGDEDPDAVWNKDELKHFCEIKNIQGLQVITELVKGDKGSFDSYELNLVLKDGSRLNVIDHGNERKLREDAERLAEFLGVPLIEK